MSMHLSQRGRDQYTGMMFALPWLIGLLLFYVYPIASSFYYSLFDANAITIKSFVGLGNYADAMRSVDMAKAVKNTLVFTLYSVPLGIFLGIALGLLLHAKIRGRNFFRAAIFVPSLVPSVAAAMVFLQLLNARFGYVNSFLSTLGIRGPAWLDSPAYSKISLTLLVQWAIGQMVITYIAALSDVPGELYDAARIDGAGVVTSFRHVTLPLITPVIFYNLILELIYAVQQFSQAYVLSNGQGEPVGSLLTYAMLIYRNAFAYFKMGLACAYSVLMFVVVAGATLFLFISSRRWVFYMGE